MDISIEHTGLILNRLRGDIPPALQARIELMDIPLLGVVPADDELAEFEFSGRPLVELDKDSAVYTAVVEILDKTVRP